MENAENLKVEAVVSATLNGDDLFFSDGSTRKIREEEKSYFNGRHPKAVRLSDDSHELVRFFDYHRHSEYSLLDGCIRVSDMVERTKYIGAVTDHGNMYCALKWYQEMKKAGKIPVIGEEFYCETIDGKKEGCHLILLAKNTEGYKNLCKLSSLAYKNIYYKPHISYEMLKKYSGGLVCTSACLGGELSRVIMNDNGVFGSFEDVEKRLDECVNFFKSVFHDDYYIEIQNHHIKEELIVNPRLIALAKRHNVKVVAATDSHYTNKGDHEIHEVLLCIGTKTTMDDPNRMTFEGDGYHLYSDEDMDERFEKYPEAIDNTLEIMEKCQYVEIETGKHYLPDFPIPEGFKDDVEYLKYVAQKGFEERFKDKFEVLESDTEEVRKAKRDKEKEYRDRWDYEMSVIEKMGFSGYFLVVWDFLKFCRDNNIPIGAGRGCVNAGTLIYTDRGLIPIENIKIGDNVYTHDGTLKPVLKTFKYPTKKGENLRHIRCFYGDSFGNAYTDNHKIYAIKAIKETDKSKLAVGIKYSDMLNPEPQWIEAKDLENGDLVAFPKVKIADNYIKKYDLSNFVNKHCTVYPEIIEEKCYGNDKTKISIHHISNETKLSRSAVKNFLGGNASVSTCKIMNEWVSKNGYSIKDIKPQINIKKCSRYLYLDENTLYFLGYMTGNGWVRSKNNEVGVCFNSNNVKTSMLDYMNEKYGFKFVKQKPYHKGAITYICYSSILKSFFLDFWKGYNFSAQTKVFPSEIFGLPDQLKMAFINGLWDSDGSHKGKSKFSSTSFKLISDLKLLLSSLNIPNGMLFRPKHYSENCNGKNSGDSWQITVPHNFKTITRKCGETTENFVFKRIYDIHEEKSDYVYDISVKDNHSYLTSNFVAHNSGAGSLVLYCLHITDFDPIKYDLLFERFLNPDRISLPDIDSDISKRKRDKVIEYVTNKYGEEHVSHIITFGTLAAKQAVKDVARVYNVPAKEANAITKTMPSAPGMTISRALKESPEFADIIKNNSLYEKVVRIAQKVEGLPRQTGVHACGIILSQKPVDEYCPTAKVKDDNGEYFTTTQFEGPECEEVGLVKFDFLGLRTLDVLDISLELIKEEKPEFNMLPENIPIDDIETYMFLKEGNTDGVFQFESDGMTSLVKQMFSDVKPDDSNEKGEEYFERLIAAVALYRPGPMDEIPNYLKAMKSGNIIYDHPKLKSILSSTYGILVYQEEIMMAVRELAGFSKGDSDKVRKAMGLFLAHLK